jgi:hypothetical protein
MTYALGWPLQEALFGALSADPECAAFFDTRIHDAPPPFGSDAEAEGLYLVIGDERVRDWSTASDEGAVHQVRLDVYAPRRSFAEAKQAAAAVSDVVLKSALTPARGRVVNARFVDARTGRSENDALRRIAMRFRFTLEDTT